MLDVWHERKIVSELCASCHALRRGSYFQKISFLKLTAHYISVDCAVQKVTLSVVAAATLRLAVAV